MNNNNMHQQMVKHDLFKPIIDLTLSESRRDNLLSGSCQDLFEHIRRVRSRDYFLSFCLLNMILGKHEEHYRVHHEEPRR